MFESIRSSYFPHKLTADVTMRSVEGTTFWHAIKAVPVNEDPFSSLVALGNYEMPEGRVARLEHLNQAYHGIHTEHILFENAVGQCIGWSHGMMREPGTFFMSYSGVLRSYQRRGIYSAFLSHFLGYLHALGYERVTSNHMVTNRAVLIAKLKAGFVITGVVLDERYGAQASLTYFFYEDRREGFARAFSLETYPGTPEYR